MKQFMTSSLLFCLVIIAAMYEKGNSQVWNYRNGEPDGPEKWYVKYPHCGGVMQSPIDIVSSQAIYSPALTSLNFSDYLMSKGDNFTLSNRGGRMVQLVYSGTPIYLLGGGLPTAYKLVQLHFHWGANQYLGSEHYMDGKSFPMEVHLVHRQVQLANFSVAQELPYGLAVVGFFFQMSERNNTKYDQLLKYFHNIVKPDTATEVESFQLTDLLPANLDSMDYYRYFGSLTTPPCYESVIWTVSTSYIPISESQINLFRNLQNENLNNFVNGYRPIQDSNHRIVTTTLQDYPSSASLTHIQLHFLLICVFIVALYIY
ncbi:carbonic anhydrase 7-like isoform X1 [Biomphalaria glabrata]|uniref:Carbonic anhydrase n=2 Tax=Biomphalaria glabrata TaxID=6526 RepID=A0A9W2Z643_BIOGL|nr:carbonic anhydrase 7-like isoform X1 [Biomphalaria glabrata]